MYLPCYICVSGVCVRFATYYMKRSDNLISDTRVSQAFRDRIGWCEGDVVGCVFCVLCVGSFGILRIVIWFYANLYREI